MKVIILKKNKIKQVKDGYARNFLIPQGLAVLATPQELKKLKVRQEKAKKDIKLLEKTELEMSLRVGETGKAFGAITASDIAKELNLNKKQVLLKKPIKKPGDYKIKIDLEGEKPQLSLRVSADHQTE